MRHFFLLIIIFCSSCKNYYNYPPFAENGNPLMVVEIPAGTNLKYEYNSQTNKFEAEIIDGKERKVSYLPYPGNYGFVPSTLMDEERGGDGDPLDVLVIGSNIKQGSLLEFVPVGVLMMLDAGEEDHKIVGVAVNTEVSVISCKTMECLHQKYPGIKEIIETWFKNYKAGNVIEIKGWKDEKFAMEMIRKWQKSSNE